jgi:AraC family transcriptional regulator
MDLPASLHPRFISGPAMMIAGLTQRHTMGPGNDIPGQWQRFVPYIGRLPGERPGVCYGVCHSPVIDGKIDYLCGVEVTTAEGQPSELLLLRLDAQDYAVFTHRGPVAAIGDTMSAIWRDWLPQSGREPAFAPTFERYDEWFNPATGSGEVDIWLPLKRQG